MRLSRYGRWAMAIALRMLADRHIFRLHRARGMILTSPHLESAIAFW